jgi:hypothetical protein
MRSQGRGEPAAPAASLPTSSVLGSRFGLGVLALAVVALMLVTFTGPSGGSAAERKAFLCETARQWRARYPAEGDLQVVLTDVVFHGTAGRFAVGNGLVVAPVALNLPGIQDLLEVVGSPSPRRAINVEGIRALVWDYAGAIHRDLRYVGAALVRRPRARPVTLPEAPTFDTLERPWRTDARLTSEELEGEPHSLNQCRAFVPWVRALAGEPPYPDQLLRLAQRLGEMRRDAALKEPDDVCSAIRANRFTPHQAQVVGVMGLRELGAPAIALMSADPDARYWVATYVDGPGWVALDITHVDRGYQLGGPPVLTMAPLTAPFEASQHGFWQVSGQMFLPKFGRLRVPSSTRWATSPSETDDVTVPSTMPLAAVCP